MSIANFSKCLVFVFFSTSVLMAKNFTGNQDGRGAIMPFSSSKTRKPLRLSDSNDSIDSASNSSNFSKQVPNSTNAQNYSLESQNEK